MTLQLEALEDAGTDGALAGPQRRPDQADRQVGQALQRQLR
ncbi:MAG: hypothetical protein ACHQ01_09710 [Candidatus Limnocylindrales bacterium]